MKISSEDDDNYNNDVNQRKQSYCRSELRDFIDRHCERIPLSPFPTKRSVPKRYKRTTSTFCERTTATNNIWTWKDTEAVVLDNNIPFEEYLGLRFYLTDPVRFVLNRAAEKKVLFIDHEFCVHEDFATSVDDDDDGGLSANEDEEGQRRRARLLTPGIITPQNCRDLVACGKHRCIRAARFVEVASVVSSPSRSQPKRSPRHERWYWKRGSEMPEGRNRVFAYPSSTESASVSGSVFASVCPQNVIQGRVGNCGFCSGIASLAAQFPEVLKSAFRFDEGESKNNNKGVLSVRLYPNGTKRFILLDDYVLCSTAAMKTRTTTSMTSTTPLAHFSPSLDSLNGDELWIRLLEKVFVKIQSSYASLDGYYKYKSLYRHPARAMQLLTGAPIALELHLHSDRRNLNSKKQKKRSLGLEEIYTVLLETEGCCARVAHGRKQFKGLKQGHGYSLLWVGTIAGVKLACLRNPHGKGSYTGEFGRCICRSAIPTKNSWCWSTTPAARVVAKALNSDNNDMSLSYLRGLLTPTYTTTQARAQPEDDDGIFLLSFDVFVECFPVISVVGPILSSGDNPTSSLLHEFPVEDCLLQLHGENIFRLRDMLRVLSDHEKQ